MSRETKTLLIAVLCATTAVFCWSGNWVLGRAVRAEVPPFGLTFARWSCAALILAPFAVPRLRAEWPRLRHGIWVIVGLAFLGGTAFQSMVYVGLQWTQAINGLLLNTTAPLYVIVMAWIVLGERLSARQWAGLAISGLGAVLLVSRGDLATIAELEFNAGDGLILIAMVVWGAYSVLLKFRPEGVTPVTLVFMISLLGAVFTIPAVIIEMAQGRVLQADRATALSVAYTGLFASVVALLCYNAAVQRIGPSRTIVFLHLMPLFGSVMAMVFLGERLELYHLIGFPVILAGVILATLARPVSKTAPHPPA